jgi:hypothetical protein
VQIHKQKEPEDNQAHQKRRIEMGAYALSALKV